jgi:HAE1 family hydrophobic/amphiphilic exporter-1
MRAMDFTLNNMTLLGLTLAVGIVIDDAIVVLENIFRHIEEENRSPFEAAIHGTREVALAVMATTLSLIVIFLPVAFMTGYARRFIYPFGWTMAFAIAVSMLVSFTLTPMLSSRFLKLADAEKDLKTKDRGFFHWVDVAYARSLDWALAHPLAILGVTVLVLGLTIPLNRMIGRTFIPAEDMGEFTAHIDTPQGTSLDGTREIAEQVVKEIGGQDGVARVTYLSGADRVNHFHIFFYLKPSDERDITQEQVMTRVRQVLARHPGLAPAISPKNPLGGGNGNFAIQATLQGPDMLKLYDYSQQLLVNAQKLPSLVDAKSNFSNASPEVHVSVDRARAADLGVRISDIGSALRLMVSGDDEISSFRDGPEQYPVKIRVLESQRDDVAAIGKLTVPSSTSGQVRVDNIAQMVRGFGPTQLRRLNRQFAIEVQADLAPGHALDEGSADMRRLMTELNLPPGYSFSMRGQTQYLDETTTNLLLAIGLASIFVYIVLAAQFESFVQPIIIMLALPVSVPFALFTIWVTGRTLNLWSALGILLLFGIVKKNSILQVDYTNVLRRRGVPMHEAIVEACRTRLRPILMTTSAIIAGLLPTALGIGIGGNQRSAIALTIIGGQSLCLFLTLLLVPVAYVEFDRLEQAVISGKARAWLASLSASWKPGAARSR